MKLHFICITLMACSLFPLTGCATTTGLPLEGTVVDEATGESLPGAIVIGRWQETSPLSLSGHTVCAHVDTASTDSAGRYRLASYKGKGPTLIDAYLKGYQRAADIPWNKAILEERKYLLKPFVGTKRERLRHMGDGFGILFCGKEEDYRKALEPLSKVMYEEAKNLATSDNEDQQILNSYLSGWESMQFGSDIALKRSQERRRVK
jgi:hypothetical protein